MEKSEDSSSESRLFRLFTAVKNEDVDEVRALISQLGGYVNKARCNDDEDNEDDDGRTPLHDAVLKGNLEILKHFVEAENVDINVKDYSSATPLHLAVQKGNTEILKLLLNTGNANVNVAEDDKGYTVLHMAAKAGNIEILKLLANAQNIDVNLRGNEGYTAFQYVLERKNFDEIKILIDAGADVDSGSYWDGKTAMCLAIEKNNASFVEYLMSRGVDINYRDEEYYYRTILHIAAEKCEDDSHLDVIIVLLENGADVNARDRYEYTPLHLLLEQRTNIKTVKLLIDFKADINLMDNNGQVPLINAVRSKNEEAIKLLLNHGCDVKSLNPNDRSTLLHDVASECRGDFLFSTFEVLLKQGAAVNAQSDYGNTPFHDLVTGAGVKTVQLFLDFGADVHVEDRYDETPLFNAVRGGNPEVAQLLIDYGSDVGIINSRGENALFSAAESCNVKVVQLLINQGINANIIDNQGENVLFTAAKSKNTEIVKLLLDYGSDVNIINDEGENPLFNAVRISKEVKILQLINKDTNVNQGKNVFFKAAEIENAWIIKLLSGHASGINIINDLGEKTLLHEVNQENVKVVQLINKSANGTVLVKQGENPLFSAAKSRDALIVKLLLDYGSKVNIVNSQGESPLFFAVKSENVEVVQLLINQGINVNIKDNNGETALFNAIRGGRVALAKLSKNNSSVHYFNSLDKYPLYSVMKSKNLEMIQLLLDNGSNINKVNNNKGWTPLHLAASFWGGFKIVKCLLKNGADANAVDSEGLTPLLVLLKETFYQSCFEKKLQFMLKYSDFDVVDHNGNHFLSYCSSENIRKICLEHIAKLQALDVSLNQSILNFISNCKELRIYFVRCTNELTIAKTTRIKTCWITLFNILVDNGKKLKNYAGNDNLITEFEKSDYLNKFPIYGASMQERMNRGIQRRKLFDKSASMLSNNWPIFSPTHLVIRGVLDYFSSQDLSKFCE